jgi:hypothetical protein
MRANEEFLRSAGERTKIKLYPKAVEPNASYRYTSPSVMGKRAVGERKAHGCIEVERDRWCFKPPGKTAAGKAKGPKCFKTEEEAIEEAAGAPVKHSPEKKFNGKRCRSGPREACTDTVYDSFCAGSNSDPCGSPRATCPVQLVWIDGKPNLRFCKEQGKPGYMVPVPDVKEAMRVSEAACAKWPYKLGVTERADGSEGEGGWDPEFFDKNAPDILKTSSTAYPDKGGLGGVRRPRKQRGNPAWLAAGVAMGVMAAVLLKNRQEPVKSPG